MLQVQLEYGFWVHSPERQRTFYFYAKSEAELRSWIQHIRHNLEVRARTPSLPPLSILRRIHILQRGWVLVSH
jgi:hypothetical protein